MRTALRIELPRLAEVQPTSRVGFALTERDRVARQGELPLTGLAAAVPAPLTVAVLHPADATLAEVAVPPLPAHRLAAAVASAIEPMTLADPEDLAIAHGPRRADGRAAVAWTARAPLARAWNLLAEAGVRAEMLVPAPLALPRIEGALTLMLRDGYVLARTGPDQGHAIALDPLAPVDDPGSAVITALRLVLGQHPDAAVVWLGAVPSWWPRVGAGLVDAAGEPRAVAVSARPADTRWSGELPGWSLALPALRPRRMQRSPWARPLAWSAAAAAIWLLGLNLHAAQLRGEERALQQRMTQQVRTAFPNVPVVLDPLRQATQQRDALRAAAGTQADSDFVPLALAVTSLLPASANNVESLAFADQELSLRLADASRAPASALDPELARRAQELGLQVDHQDGVWHVRRQEAGAPPGSAPPPAGVAIQPGAATLQRIDRQGAAAR